MSILHDWARRLGGLPVVRRVGGRRLLVAGIAALLGVGVLAMSYGGARRAGSDGLEVDRAAAGIGERAVDEAVGRAVEAVAGKDGAWAGSDSRSTAEAGTVENDPAAGAWPQPESGWSPPDLRAPVEPVPADSRVPRPDAVRAIYVNSWSAGSARKMERLLSLADRTEINAFVIDVKDVSGYVSYDTRVPLAREIGAHGQLRIQDVRGLLARLKEHGVYPIARIVAFKDPVLASRRPEWSIRTADGGTWTDHNGEYWVDAFSRSVWEYNLSLAREAVALGFAEVQWDYVRFPDVPRSHAETAVYAARDGRTMPEAIGEFMGWSRDAMADFGVPVTADVFGITTSASNDVGIGQYWELMADRMDVLLPMVYPSHYPRGSFGIPHPNADPYRTVRTAMERGVARSDTIQNAALIRPWLQDFTLGDPPYGPAYVRAQIQAVYDAGLEEWVLWNPSSNYTAEALADRHGARPYLPELADLVDGPLPEPEVEVVPLGRPK